MLSMLSMLSTAPTTVSARGVGAIVFVRTRWLSNPPVRNTRTGPLDTAADLPDRLDDEPPPRPRPTSWQRRGLCRKLPLDLSDPLFFGDEGQRAPEDLIVAVQTARRLCVQCPTRGECLTYALANDMRYGVWGGTSGKQREKMRLRLVAGASVEELVAECLDAPSPR
jgi:WhiB family transcriptional regulator, redox-sensing transcriptional regulator